MSIKAKITAALSFMFLVVLLLGGLGAYHLTRLSADAEAILQDNFITHQYVSQMQKALTTRGDPDALSDFEAALRRQETNITEVGEREATRLLRREFDRYRGGATDSLTVSRIQQSLFSLDDLNRQAIIRKNETARQTAREALSSLVMVGTISVLVLFTLIINFPGYIATPLQELTRGIRSIASRNFEERLHFKSSDEFGELARSFNSMAQKLDEYEHSSLARVLFEKKRIDTLIHHMSEGIIGLDEARRILFANAVACRLLGVDEARLVGQYAPDVATQNDLLRTLIQEVTGPDSPASTGSKLLKIFDGGKEAYFNQRIHRVAVTRTGEDGAQEAGFVIVLENVTPYKELDLAKTNFIATVSHELKTPLSSMKMSLKLLEDVRVGLLNGEQQELVEHLRQDTERLLKLTGELLNMAQVESGQLQLILQPVAPETIVGNATAALRVAAEGKGISFRVHLEANLPLVLTDPDKATWVLVNMLSNAVRHSPADRHLEVSAERQDGYVAFRVRDYGPGIPPEHQSRVFDRYFKGPASAGPSTRSGLGLAISKDVVGAMNGQIGLDSGVTDGSAFYFCLPVSGEE